jgi:hypothetical protein
MNNITSKIESELLSYIECMGENPKYIVLSTKNYDALKRYKKSEDVSRIEIKGVELKVITGDYLDDYTLYCTNNV